MELSTPRTVAGVLALLVFGQISGAAENYPFFRGVRGDAMGGAAINVVDDETSLFYNPAGLGKIRGPYFAALNLQAEMSNQTQSLLSQNSQYLDFRNPQNILALAKLSPNTNIHAEAQTLPAFVTTNFGVGLYSKYQSDGMWNPGTSTFQFNYFNDTGAVVGYCFRLFSGRLKIGLSGKIIDRVYVNQSYASPLPNLSLSNIAQDGIGAGWDGSVMLSAPWVWLPSLTAVVHDVGGTNFTLTHGAFVSNSNPPPPPQQQSVDVGFGLFPIFTNYSRGSITAEYHDVLNYNSADPMRQLHAGIEFDFNDVLFLRGGVNEMYWTAGIEIAVGHNQIQLASYGEEIGPIPYHVEDRRYVIQYGLRF